ncbi:MAG TPA: carboxypeptidase regulatory-like domain-containing protein [Bryobacteraceae bacterium]|nr:carboxypeptidase regulatory-like domain-containing protein [Bryobacteraceae bacterium]
MNRTRTSSVCFSLLFFLLPAALLAQGTVTIYGTVNDPTGGAVANVSITATNEATGQSRQTLSGADGNYVIPDLPIGTYKLTAQATGFKTFVQQGIQVQVNENRRVPIQLALGTVTENVTVQAEVAQVETRSGALKDVIDSHRIVELPLNGRNPLQLQYLVAGSGGITAAGQAENDSVSINGSRANANNYTLDGADNHDPFFDTPSVFPNPDALDEFSLQTSSYSADQGRNAGALMTAVTKSGTNQLHGTLFEFVRNQAFDARNFFANTVSPFHRNQFGSTVGGPIRKDKTFFFGSYQGTRQNSSPGTQTPTVFTAAERSGDFSAMAKALKDPLGGTFPGNVIPASRISQPVLNFMNAFVPLPNTPGGQYTFASQQTIVDDQAIGKIDHSLSSKNQLSGRLMYERNNTNQVVTNTTLPGFLALIEYRNWNVAINDIHTFSAHLVNQFTFGFNDITREQLPTIPQQKSWVDFGSGIIRSAPGPIAYDTEVNSYFNAESRYLLDQYRKGFQYSDGIDWSVGSHTLKIGGDLRQSMVDQNQNFQTDPRLVFAATYTGVPLADFLIGRETTFIEGSPNAGKPRTLESDLYIQDDWKVNKRLTLNLGLRWDPFLPFHDLDNAISQVRLGQQSTVFPTAPSGYVFPGDAGVSSTTIPARWANLAPRFGFAFDPFGTGKTSIRGAYGIFYSDIRQQAMNNLSSNEPYAISLNVSQPSGGLVNPYSDTGNPFPFQPPVTAQEKQNFKFFLPLTTITEWDPDFRDARVQQWNFSVQQQLFSDWILTAAYVGSTGNHLFIQNELDPAIYGKAGATVNARRLLAPNFTSITDMLSVANSSYNALQVTANKRFHHGFTVLVNYTWSKSIDEGSGDGSQAANPFNIRNSRGVSDFDIPQRFVASFIWQLPGVTSHGAFTRWVAGGWEVNGIVTLQSGTPFTVTSGVDNSQSGLNLDRADLVGNPALSGSRSKAQMIQEYFNTAAFTVNALGTFGDAGRNILFGPGTEDVDFGAIKSFNITERYKAQFRAESFNLFNHANLANPNGSVSASNFGTITATATTAAGSPRVLQLALKFMF